MTINQVLLFALKNKIKVNINIHNISMPFINAIIKKVGRDYVTFLVVEYQERTEHIYEYTFKKILIIGVGYSKASLDLEEKDEDDFIDIFLT
jgi:hypothetical protein